MADTNTITVHIERLTAYDHIAAWKKWTVTDSYEVEPELDHLHFDLQWSLFKPSHLQNCIDLSIFF